MNPLPQRFQIALAGVITCLLSPAYAATEAMTDPVGFVTITATGGSVSSPKLSLVSPTLTHAVDWQGSILTISSNTTGPTTITVSGTPWTANQFNGANGSYYVEVISANTPSLSGALGDISGTTTSSITVSDNLSAFGVANDLIKIRKHVTLADFLGATNPYGLLGSDDPSTADEVLLYSGTTYASYFYYTGSPGFPAGWYKSDFSASANNDIIGPNDGVVIRRRASGTVSIVASGSVKTGNTLFPVVNGLNVLGTVSAKGLTLDTSGLYTGDASTGVKPSSDPSTADEVTIYAGTTPKTYFYYNGGLGFADGWYVSDFSAAAGSVSMPPGTSFVLKRKGGIAFNWHLPAPSSF